MKYKLYAIKDFNHEYYKEIRGIRFEHQYHLLPECAQWISKEYNETKNPIPQLFHKDEFGKDINFARWKANDDFTDIVSIGIDEMQASERYKRYIKEIKVKKHLAKKMRKLERDHKRTVLEEIKVEFPNLSTQVNSLKTQLDEEESNDN